VDIVVVTPREQTLGILALPTQVGRARDGWELPWTAPRVRESLVHAARRLVRAHAGGDAMWMEQIGAFADGRRHPSGSPLSVCFIAAVPAGTALPARDNGAWFDSGAPPAIGARQREMIASAVTTLQWRMDYAPIPFRLLPPLFTLTDLQETYELLLGRRLHKASFRRALHAAWLVEPTDEWRSEGRGRPAQLFRFAPRKRRSHHRGVRFDLLRQ
jgi:8-oxo-dGTP diphosphatase